MNLQKYKNRKKQNKKFFIYVVLLIVSSLIFYLRQQYLIIKFQNEISQLYDKLVAEESLNKKLEIEFQQYTDPEYLKKFVSKLNFVPVSKNDLVIIE